MTAFFPAPVGSLDQRFEILAPAETPDGAGGVTRTFVVIGGAWGRIELKSADERWQADREEQAALFRIELRWRAGINAGLRLVLGARRFDIRTANDPDGSRRRLILLAEEVKP